MSERIQGRVIDTTGSPLPLATVTLTNSGREIAKTTTRLDGGFSFTLDEGVNSRLMVKVGLDGFQDFEQAIDLQQGQAGRIEITLNLAAQTLSITVTEKVGYQTLETLSATKTATPLLNVPQSISIINSEQMRDQLMLSMADVVRFTPGITMAQGEGHRDAPIIRGNATTSDFFVNGVRDDVQYFRDLYNLERVEALKGPNAMVFGRGGGGGVLNRVTKEAGFTPLREVSLLGGSFGNRRVSADFDQPLTTRLAFRLNALYEDSNSFRRFGNLNRYGVSPTFTWLASDKTKIRVAYERFHDARVVDRGVPSFQGRPAAVDHRLFFGNPDASHSRADVNLGSVTLEQQLGAWNLRNQTLFGGYDKYYANVFPGAVNAAGTQVSLSAYDNATARVNFFNQTDLVRNFKTGSIRHTLLTGVEIGRQGTDNLRLTGFFPNSSATLLAPIENPTVFTPVTFRSFGSDANNRVVNRVGAFYVQDQIEVSRYLQFVVGARLDHFDLNLRNNRNGENLGRVDNMLSPRLGVVVKPMERISLYGNYSVSFLPSAGDQFASLTATSQALRPEKFHNYEAGLKWDLARGLTFNTAIYRLDRTNTTALDPNNPGRIVQTGSQRSNGIETSLNGRITSRWNVSGGWAWQDAFIASTTTAARAGARVAQVPRNSASFWNHYRVTNRLSTGLGLIHQSAMYAGIDNAVKINGFSRADAAVYYQLTESIRAQANIENLTDRRYIVNAHNNNNLTPGYARAVRIGLTARF